MNHRVFIGIEGGGSHSFGVAVDDAGRVLAMARSGALNFYGNALPRARRNLDDLVKAIERQLPDGTQAERFVIGCAAFFTDAADTEKEGFCRGIVPMKRTRLVGDCLTAYHGASLGRPGVLVISGTGSIVLVRNEAGTDLRAGGWGHLLGDAGSAWWIAAESIKAAIAAEEGLGPATQLACHVCHFHKVQDLTQIIPIVYDAQRSKDKFAALSGFLAGQAGDDPVFQEICRRAGRELAAQALAALNRASVQLSPVPLYLAGGVLERNALVRDNLVAAMKAERPIVVTRPQMPALLGAAALALSEGGTLVTAQVLENLKSTYAGAFK